MRTLLITAACFLSLNSWSQPINNKSNSEQEIKRLMKDWVVAAKNRDEKSLNKIVATEFKLDGTYPFDQPPLSRERWMANIMNNLKIDSVYYYDMKVDIIEDVAIVKSKFYWAGSFLDKSFADSSSVLIDTWLKRDQAWQVVSRIRVDKPE